MVPHARLPKQHRKLGNYNHGHDRVEASKNKQKCWKILEAMADGRAPMGIPHVVEDSVCLGRSVGMAFKDVPTTKIASQVMELGSLSTTS